MIRCLISKESLHIEHYSCRAQNGTVLPQSAYERIPFFTHLTSQFPTDVFRYPKNSGLEVRLVSIHPYLQAILRTWRVETAPISCYWLHYGICTFENSWDDVRNSGLTTKVQNKWVLFVFLVLNQNHSSNKLHDTIWKTMLFKCDD